MCWIPRKKILFSIEVLFTLHAHIFLMNVIAKSQLLVYNIMERFWYMTSTHKVSLTLSLAKHTSSIWSLQFSAFYCLMLYTGLTVAVVITAVQTLLKCSSWLHQNPGLGRGRLRWSASRREDQPLKKLQHPRIVTPDGKRFDAETTGITMHTPCRNPLLWFKLLKRQKRLWIHQPVHMCHMRPQQELIMVMSHVSVLMCYLWY
jgi:hypothetical protein